MKIDTYRIHIRDLVIYAYHGALEAEQALGQRFVLNLVLEMSADADCSHDTLDGKVDYAAVHTVVADAFTSQKFTTLEACAHAMGEAIFGDFPLVETCEIRIEKPSVPIDCTCESFGVSLRLSR